MSILLDIIRGFAMGSADIVPGVSGGTIALVLGIYERFIGSIRAGSKALTLLVRADVAGFRRWMAAVEWAFIIPLLAGIGGMAAAYDLAKAGHQVVIYEADDHVGGLAAGFSDTADTV